MRADGWIELKLPVADRATFLTWVLGFGADAEVVAPPALREAAIARLRGVAGGAA
jgi:proteasome accessory factor B